MDKLDTACERTEVAAHLASQSQAAQPTDTTDEATKWAETYYRNADALTFRDLGIVQAAWAEATRRAHIAGTSQATKAQIECEWPTCECVLDLDNCKASREAQAGSARDAALARMERAEWYAVFSALRDARTALSKGDIQHTWLDGAITLAEARVKGQGDHAAAPTGQATKAQAEPIYQYAVSWNSEGTPLSWTDTNEAVYKQHVWDAKNCRTLYAAPVAKEAPAMPELVNRFLAWPLPASLTGSMHINIERPIGTHLMNADEAKAMFEHVLDRRFRAQGGNTNNESSDRAPTTSTVSAPPGDAA